MASHQVEFKRFHVSSPEEREIMKDPTKVSCRLFVGNLPTDYMERKDLADLFSKYGEITGVLLNRGFGFIQFEKEESTAEVLKQGSFQFRGKHIDVKPARTLDRKPPQQKKWEPEPPVERERERERERSPGKEYYDRGRDVTKYPVEQQLRESRAHQNPTFRTSNADRGNDCEIIVVHRNQTKYAEFIELKLKKLGLSVDLMFPNEDIAVTRVLSNVASRGCLYAILIMPQNEDHRSLTLNILHGQPQEHRNMPLEDAINLLARNFDAYLLREKLSRPSEVNVAPATAAVNLSDKHPESIQVLLNLLADNRQLTVLQFDKVITYLTDRRELQVKLELGDTGPSTLPLTTGNHQHQELQSRILSILNNKPSPAPAPGPLPMLRPNLLNPAPPVLPPAVGGPPPLLNDPNVQKALDSLMQGDLLRKFSGGVGPRM